jgi:hypothetical protein
VFLEQYTNMGKVSLAWLLATEEALTQGEGLKEFVKSSKVCNKAFIAQRCSNSHGFLWLFLCFEAASEFKINLAKPEPVPVGAGKDGGGLACILGCRLSSLSMKISGLPLGV